MKKIKVGVIGAGGIGRFHILGFQKIKDVEIVGVVDIEVKKRKATKDEFNLPTFESTQKLYEETKPDVVVIGTPNITHKPLTIEAFIAGCHVLCEKPMAMNTREATQMLDASKKYKKRLMINFSYRFTHEAWALKQQVESGVLGDVYFARTIWHRRDGIPYWGGWFTQKDKAGGGPLIDLGVHRLDLALWYMGYPKPVWVMGSAHDHLVSNWKKGKKNKIDVEDFAVGLIKFDNGATLEIEASWMANIKEAELMETRLLGTQGGLVQRNVGEGYDFEGEIFINKDDYQYNLKLNPPISEEMSSRKHFIDCLRSGKKHIATGEEGLIVMGILEAIYKSAKLGKPIKL